MRGTPERRGLVGGAEEALLVVQVGPFAFAAVGAQLAGGVQAAGFSFAHGCWGGRSLADGAEEEEGRGGDVPMCEGSQGECGLSVVHGRT